MNTKEEFIPTKAHKILSITFPILMALSSFMVADATGFMPATFFFVMSIIFIWRLPPNRFKLIALIIFIVCFIAYVPFIIFFVLMIAHMLDGQGLHP